MIIIATIAAFAAGWAVRGAFENAMMRIALRVFSTAAGKEAILAGLAKVQAKP